MPRDLEGLCTSVRAASEALRRPTDQPSPAPSFDPPRLANGESGRRWRQTDAKAMQVASLVAATCARAMCVREKEVRRVVDVGCGVGHLIAQLQHELGVPALGLDRDPQLLARGRQTYPLVTFEVCDVSAHGLRPFLCDGDLVVALHPCGILGEVVVEDVAAHGQVSLLMVPCCLHKQGSEARPPLSTLGAAAGLTLPLRALKKASMALDSSSTVVPRRARHALRALLLARGIPEEEMGKGGEMEGIQSRIAARGFAELARVALRKRGLAPPTQTELEAVELGARHDFEQLRRLSLLEVVQGELLEILVLLDRALRLTESTLSVQVFCAFVASASDRNLAILAEPRRERGSGLAVPSTVCTSGEQADALAPPVCTLCATCDLDTL